MIQDNLEKYSKLCFLLPQEILKSCVLYLRVRRKARFIRVACASMINLAVTFSAKKKSNIVLFSFRRKYKVEIIVLKINNE